MVELSDSGELHDAEILRQRVGEISWFHQMALPHGVMTPGIRDVSRTLPRLGFPESFAGRDVLDIGAWDGFYSFEAKRRGASRVVASDWVAWLEGNGWGSKAGFVLARDALQLDVEDVHVDVMDLSPERVGTFDDVLFLGVLYHLRDPITALERVASVTRDRLILETETTMPWLRRPTAEVHLGGRLNGDDTNCYAHNPTALRLMLARAGFGRIEVIHRERLPYRMGRATLRSLQKQSGWREKFRSQRIVIHAWKQPSVPTPRPGGLAIACNGSLRRASPVAGPPTRRRRHVAGSTREFFQCHGWAAAVRTAGHAEQNLASAIGAPQRRVVFVVWTLTNLASRLRTAHQTSDTGCVPDPRDDAHGSLWSARFAIIRLPTQSMIVRRPPGDL